VTPIEPDGETQGLINKLKAKSMLYDQNIENTRNLGESTQPKKWSETAYQTGLVLIAGIGIDRILIALGVLK